MTFLAGARLVAYCLLAGSLGVYAWLLYAFGKDIGDSNILQKLLSLAIRVPRQGVPAYINVLAGTAFLCGLSVLAGLQVLDIHPNVVSQEGKLGVVCGAAGFALAGLGILVSLKTLNQTKHLEDVQGNTLRGVAVVLEQIQEETYRMARRRGKAHIDDDAFKFIILARVPLLGVVSDFEGKGWLRMHNCVTECKRVGIKVTLIHETESKRQEILTKEFDGKPEDYATAFAEDTRFIKLVDDSGGLRKEVSGLPAIGLVFVGNKLFEMKFGKEDPNGARFSACRVVGDEEIVKGYDQLMRSYQSG